MSHDFDLGYGPEPFASLVADYPGEDVYPARDFRVEWGPIFHRGRLDGSARVLVLGQDPGAHEAVARRTLVGEAGQRIQGFLARLGVVSRYAMINTFVYSVYGQRGGERHRDDPAIAAYRTRWLDALLVGSQVEVVVALGRLAELAFRAWLATPAGGASVVAWRRILHPTYPESASAAGQATKAEATRELLADWNAALDELRPRLVHPETPPVPGRYGDRFDPAADFRPVPEADLPAGLPAWMRSLDAWAARRGADAATKRATLVVTVPRNARPPSG